MSDQRDGADGDVVPGEGTTAGTTAELPAETAAETRRAGRMRRQDESTTPREPTLAERRAASGPPAVSARGRSSASPTSRPGARSASGS